MGRETLKVTLSVLGAGLGAFFAFLLLEIFLPGGRHSGGALLLRFQVSAMLAMALLAGLAIVILAGLAIVIYVRLSR